MNLSKIWKATSVIINHYGTDKMKETKFEAQAQRREHELKQLAEEQFRKKELEFIERY